MVDQETLSIFDKLYYGTYQEVLKYIVINCSNIEDVKDIIQNVYLEVLKKLNNKNIQMNKSYIIGIAKNKIKEYYRFHYKVKFISLFSNIKKNSDLDLIDTIGTDVNIEKIIIEKQDIEFIWEYLKKQKPIIFKIFFLYYYMDYNIKEISWELNISEANVKNYLYRTLNKLKWIMKGNGE